jgi:hypothetical protein
VLHIASHVIEPWQSPAVATLLFHLFHSTEITARGIACALRRQSSSFVLGRQQVEMLADLLIKCRVERPSPEQREHAPESRAKRHDEDSPSIRLIIATVFDHKSASMASCFLPARVIE